MNSFYKAICPLPFTPIVCTIGLSGLKQKLYVKIFIKACLIKYDD